MIKEEKITINDSNFFIGDPNLLNLSSTRITNIENNDNQLLLNMELGEYLVEVPKEQYSSILSKLLSAKDEQLEISLTHTEVDLSTTKKVFLGTFQTTAPQFVFDTISNLENWLLYKNAKIIGINFYGCCSNEIVGDLRDLGFISEQLSEDYYTIFCQPNMIPYIERLIDYLSSLFGVHVEYNTRTNSSYEELLLNLYRTNKPLLIDGSICLKSLQKWNTKKIYEVIGIKNANDLLCGLTVTRLEN